MMVNESTFVARENESRNKRMQKIVHQDKSQKSVLLLILERSRLNILVGEVA